MRLDSQRRKKEAPSRESVFDRDGEKPIMNPAAKEKAIAGIPILFLEGIKYVP
jgi:hypothetical protein